MMLKRTLYFGNPYHLSLERSQLLFQSKDGELVDRCPITDLGVLVLDNNQIRMSIPLLVALAEANVAVVLCDRKHLPVAQLQSLRGHSLMQRHQSAQLSAGVSLKKRLWQQTVRAKIANQIALLEGCGCDSGRLPIYRNQVKSGDSDNREAVAAQYYWQSLWGKSFVRLTHGDKKDSAECWQNTNFLLNYGYAVLRAAVARALIGSGLLLSSGIMHHNQYNPYPLADDIMEPYRPYVDCAVQEIMNFNVEKFSEQEIKRSLLALLACDVKISKVSRPLMNALSISSASLVRCFLGETKSIKYPEFSRKNIKSEKQSNVL